MSFEDKREEKKFLVKGEWVEFNRSKLKFVFFDIKYFNCNFFCFLNFFEGEI